MSKNSLWDIIPAWLRSILRSDLKDADPDFTQRSHKGDNVVPQSINAHFDPAKHHIQMSPVIGVITIDGPLSYGQSGKVVLPLTAQASNDRRPMTKVSRQESKEHIHKRQLQMAVNCGVPIMHPLFLFMEDGEVDKLLVIAKSLAEDSAV